MKRLLSSQDGHLPGLIMTKDMIEALFHVFTLLNVEATRATRATIPRDDLSELLRPAETTAEGKGTLL